MDGGNVKSYTDCQHHMLFIASESGAGDGIAPYRRSAFVCRECGLFRVHINGQRMEFVLVADDQVTAAGLYATYLKAAERNLEESDNAEAL